LGSVAEPCDQLLIDRDRVLGAVKLTESDALVVERDGDLFAGGGFGSVAESCDHLVISSDRVLGAVKLTESDACL
jgi:hypothetical protein